MIYVIDDGGKYSDRHYYFALARTPAEGDILERAVKLRASLDHYGWKDAKIALKAAGESVEVTDRPCSLRDAVEGLLPGYYLDSPEDDGHAEWAAIMKDLAATERP